LYANKIKERFLCFIFSLIHESRNKEIDKGEVDERIVLRRRHIEDSVERAIVSAAALY